MSKIITVLLVRPMKAPETIIVRNTEEAMGQKVYGKAKVIYPFRDKVAIVTNETARIDGGPFGNPPNRAIRSLTGRMKDYIVGSFIICGIRDGEYVSLTDRQLKKYTEKFKTPEIFYIREGGVIEAVPVDK